MCPVCLLKFTHLKAIVLEAIIQSNNNLKVSLLLSLTDVGNICFSVSMSTCVNWQLLANVSVIVYWRRGQSLAMAENTLICQILIVTWGGQT